MKRNLMVSVLYICLAGALMSLAGVPGAGTIALAGTTSESDIQRGLDIAPVRLDLTGKNRALVARGSYIVNAQGGCNDCHTCPSFTEGHDPHQGQPEEINAANYLAGGAHFGPFIVSANVTPDGNGLPAGHTYEEFVQIMRTGVDPVAGLRKDDRQRPPRRLRVPPLDPAR